jgi:hypothetical protein
MNHKQIATTNIIAAVPRTSPRSVRHLCVGWPHILRAR